MQHEYSVVLHKLKKSPRKPEYIKDKKIFWTMQKNNDAREIIINAFKNKIIPLYYEDDHFEGEDEIRDENGFINYEAKMMN